MSLGAFHTARYPVNPGALRQSYTLPSKAPGEVRTYRADFADFLISADRTVASVSGLCDPSLTAGALGHDATGVLLTVGGGSAATPYPAIELVVPLAPDGQIIWTLIQPIDNVALLLPDDPLTIGGLALTVQFQPVELSQLQPLAGGAQPADQVLVLRSGVLGTLPHGAGNQGGDPNLADFVFPQAMPSATWTITHNLGRRPMPRIVTTSGDLVEGDVHYVDANTVILSFAAAFAGTAYL